MSFFSTNRAILGFCPFAFILIKYFPVNIFFRSKAEEINDSKDKQGDIY